jgi:hypothetical protein
MMSDCSSTPAVSRVPAPGPPISSGSVTSAAMTSLRARNEREKGTKKGSGGGYRSL